MRCKKCGTVLAERNYEKCLCDDCQNKTVGLHFLGWCYIIEGIVTLLFCLLAILFFHIVSFGKAALLLIGIITCIYGSVKGFSLLQKNLL